MISQIEALRIFLYKLNKCVTFAELTDIYPSTASTDLRDLVETATNDGVVFFDGAYVELVDDLRRFKKMREFFIEEGVRLRFVDVDRRFNGLWMCDFRGCAGIWILEPDFVSEGCGTTEGYSVYRRVL